MNKIIVIVALTIVGAATQAWAKTCPPGHHPAVNIFSPVATIAPGSARACVDDDGAHASLDVKGLTPGHAYTVWFVYIDDPSLCVNPAMCADLADVTGANPAAVLGRLDSTVANYKGEMKFSGDINGMKVSPGSMVQLVIMSHGLADNADLRNRARQLLTPQDPPLGAPGLGVLSGPFGSFWGVAAFTF